jgi:hypothetical protein
VAEGHAVAVGHEHVLAHGLADRPRQLRLVEVGSARQQLVMHAPAADGGGAHHVLPRGAEAVDAGEQHVPQALGQPLRAAVARGRHQLLGEERVALRAGEDRLGERLRRAALEDALELGERLGGSEASELHALDARPARGLGQEVAQRPAAVDLVAAIGGDEQQALVAQAADEEGQEVEGGAIGPVDVLEGEDDRRDQRQLAQHLEDGHERAGARGRAAPDRDELGRRLHGRCAAPALVLLGERAQRVGDRQQRDRGVLEVGALADEHARTGVARP